MPRYAAYPLNSPICDCCYQMSRHGTSPKRSLSVMTNLMSCYGWSMSPSHCDSSTMTSHCDYLTSCCQSGSLMSSMSNSYATMTTRS